MGAAGTVRGCTAVPRPATCRGTTPAASGRAPTKTMTHRRPRGGAGCSAPRHVRAGLRMPPGRARMPTDAASPASCPPRPPGRSRCRVAGGRARRASRRRQVVHAYSPGVASCTTPRAFREPKWTPVEETAAWAPAPRAQPRARPALAHPGGCQHPRRRTHAAPRAALPRPHAAPGAPPR